MSTPCGRTHLPVLLRSTHPPPPHTPNQLRFKIFRNIGHAFVRLGQFQDAIQSFEAVMGGSPDHGTGFHLVVCYYALGDTEKMKRAFAKLLSVPVQGMAEEDEEEDPVGAEAWDGGEGCGRAWVLL
jgi:intraflagellar transport protein 88